MCDPVMILLVEDDLAHAEIVRRSLAEHNFSQRMVHLRDGQAALDYLFPESATAPVKLELPDLILLDLRLPKVDGQQVLRRIKADPALRRIPTVVLSTSHAEGDIRAAYENGACSYLVKSTDFEWFTRVMDAFRSYWLACNRYPGSGADSDERLSYPPIQDPPSRIP